MTGRTTSNGIFSMDKTGFLTIYCTFGNLDVVKQTLPSVLEETKRADARLIVHDSTVGSPRDQKWAYLTDLNQNDDFFMLLSTNMSMAHARNMCLHLGQELYAPDIVAMMEDDHGYQHGFIDAMTRAVEEHYGKPMPNGLRAGLFTGCARCNKGQKVVLPDTKHLVRAPDEKVGLVGGANSCFRCAPTAHWVNVLKGYDTDEYLISRFQTKGINERNYNKGFSSLIVESGELMFDVEAEGRGTSGTGLPLWDDDYCASDQRSRYRGKPGVDETAISEQLRAGKDLAKKTLKRLLK